MDVRAPDLAALAKALKESGDKDLRRELYRGVNRAVKPVKAAIKTSAGTLPRRGGLAAVVAKAKLSTRTKTAQSESGVRVLARSRYSLYHLNQGQVRHGPRGKVQTIAPGWWDKPTEAAGPDAQRELLHVMDDVARRIDRAV